MRIGPSTCLAPDMLRPDVLLCLGEEAEEIALALAESGRPGRWQHFHRTFSARADEELLILAGGLGSAVVETSLWELLRPGTVRRIVLVGTAGSLPGFGGEVGRPYLMDPAHSVYQNFEATPEQTWSPSWRPDIAPRTCISTDRFYGFSDHAVGYPAEPGLQQAWSRYRDVDGVVDMEVAAFYHYASAFGRPGLQYTALKAVANRSDELHFLPDRSQEVLHQVVQAGLGCFASG